MSIQSWYSNLDGVVQVLRDLLPSILAAVALLLFGLLLARLLRSWSRRFAHAVLQRLARSDAVRSALDRADMMSTLPRVVATFVFWLVFLFFAATALEALGLPVVTDSLSQFVYYLPNVLAAALIVAAGLVVGTIARGLASAAATSTGVAFSPAVGQLAYATVVLVAIVVALEQLGIDSSALVVLLTVVSGSILAGFGLAFGLGARATVSNIIASQYLARLYEPGQVVRIEGIEGRVLETTRTAVLIETAEGRVMVPASRFSEEPSTLLTGTR